MNYKTASKKSLTKRLSTQRHNRQLKSGATNKIATKSDLIRSLLQKGKTPSEVRKEIEKRGMSCYASEVYRIQNEA